MGIPGQIAKIYDYQGISGETVFQVVRFEPKDFRQRRPGLDGEWIWNLEGVDPIPYRLPGIMKHRNRKSPIFIAEGEKDVDTLTSLGVVATCNAGGAGKWKLEFRKYFYGYPVAIIPDNDEPGKKHALDVARKLDGSAESIKIISLGMDQKKFDVSDWVDMGGGKKELFELYEKEKFHVPEKTIKNEIKIKKTIEYDYEKSNTLEIARNTKIYEIVGTRSKRKIKCLWHDDGKPSLFLYDDGHGFCFVCMKRVDSIEYVMKSSGKTFWQAVKLLAYGT